MIELNIIKKRSGETQNFDPAKIKKAMEKAFVATRINYNEDGLNKMLQEVVEKIKTLLTVNGTPTVEHIQNFVEKVLMENGFYEVAKAYIIYRYEHAKQRDQKKEENFQKIQSESLKIINDSGATENFSFEKLKNHIAKFTIGIEKSVDVEEVATQCKNELYDQIKTSEIEKSLLLVTRSFIEKDPAYSILAARLSVYTLYKEVFGKDFNEDTLKETHQKLFKEKIRRGVEIGRLNPKMLVFDFDFLSSKMDLERDNELRYLGVQTLYDRYFLRDPESKEILETPQMFWMRVSMGLAINEKDYNKKAVEFYEVISKLLFVPSTPTLFHAGTNHPQLSSCYITTIEDSLDHIFKCVADNAQMSKWSGGVGNDWTNLRAMSSLIKGTGVESQGIVPFLKIANDTTVAINRSGRRRGATCAYLEVWHMDFEDFLELRRNTGDERRRTHDMNTAAWVPDLFMKRVRDNKEWTLFSPDETPDLHHIYGSEFERAYEKYEQKAKEGSIKLFKTIKAQDLWKKIISMLFETGHPWITFKDPCNVRSPQDHVGVIHSSNLCTEITLNTSSEETAVCNLGSVNLVNHIKDKKLDVELIGATVKTAMRMLDNVIDINFYPTKEGRESNLKHRPVGLGIMGYQDTLYELNIPFDSEENIKFANESMEIISYFAIEGSMELAKERGAYSTFRGSKWDRGILPADTVELLEKERGEQTNVNKIAKLDWGKLKQEIKDYGMRNSNCMAVAPTATISNIAGSCPSIEPIYKNIYVKSNMSGEFTVVNEYLVKDLKKLNLWNKEMLQNIKRFDGSISQIDAIPTELRNKYKEVFEIDPSWLIKAAAHRGKWIDQSQSVNLFIRGTSGKIISDTYLLAWQMGLKTTYYLRSLAATHVEKSTLEISKQNLTKSEDANNEVKLCKINDPSCESCQ